MTAWLWVYLAAGCLTAGGLSLLCFAAQLRNTSINYHGLWLGCLLAWPVVVIVVPSLLGMAYNALHGFDEEGGGSGDDPGPPQRNY